MKSGSSVTPTTMVPPSCIVPSAGCTGPVTGTVCPSCNRASVASRPLLGAPYAMSDVAWSMTPTTGAPMPILSARSISARRLIRPSILAWTNPSTSCNSSASIGSPGCGIRRIIDLSFRQVPSSEFRVPSSELVVALTLLHPASSATHPALLYLSTAVYRKNEATDDTGRLIRLVSDAAERRIIDVVDIHGDKKKGLHFSARSLGDAKEVLKLCCAASFKAFGDV